MKLFVDEQVFIFGTKEEVRISKDGYHTCRYCVFDGVLVTCRLTTYTGSDSIAEYMKKICHSSAKIYFQDAKV